jgi:hypothetical protein
MNLQRRFAGGDGLRKSDCRLLLFRIEAHRSRLRAAVVDIDLHALEFELDRIQRNGVGGHLDVDVNHFRTGKRGSL